MCKTCTHHLLNGRWREKFHFHSKTTKLLSRQIKNRPERPSLHMILTVQVFSRIAKPKCFLGILGERGFEMQTLVPQMFLLSLPSTFESRFLALNNQQFFELWVWNFRGTKSRVTRYGMWCQIERAAVCEALETGLTGFEDAVNCKDARVFYLRTHWSGRKNWLNFNPWRTPFWRNSMSTWTMPRTKQEVL